MTTPGGSVNPDVDFVWSEGTSFGRDITEQSFMQLTRGALGGFEETQGSWHGLVSDLGDLANEVRDGQLDLIDRLDLLDGVSGYCSLFLSANWQVAQNQLLTLPFDTQLGPAKNAAPHGGNGILLGSKGLWRADAHVTADKMTNSSFQAQVYVSVMNISTGAVFTEHEYDIVLTPSGSETAAFSHTFVIPTDGTYVVRARLQHNRTARLKVFGGTVRSALSVNKWDSRTEHAVVLPVAPDGGDLG